MRTPFTDAYSLLADLLSETLSSRTRAAILSVLVELEREIFGGASHGQGQGKAGAQGFEDAPTFRGR